MSDLRCSLSRHFINPKIKITQLSYNYALEHATWTLSILLKFWWCHLVDFRCELHVLIRFSPYGFKGKFNEYLISCLVVSYTLISGDKKIYKACWSHHLRDFSGVFFLNILIRSWYWTYAKFHIFVTICNSLHSKNRKASIIELS